MNDQPPWHAFLQMLACLATKLLDHKAHSAFVIWVSSCIVCHLSQHAWEILVHIQWFLEMEKLVTCLKSTCPSMLMWRGVRKWKYRTTCKYNQFNQWNSDVLSTQELERFLHWNGEDSIKTNCSDVLQNTLWNLNVSKKLREFLSVCSIDFLKSYCTVVCILWLSKAMDLLHMNNSLLLGGSKHKGRTQSHQTKSEHMCAFMLRIGSFASWHSDPLWGESKHIIDQQTNSNELSNECFTLIFC